jgi:cell wall-associated NlpC family hydrolase
MRFPQIFLLAGLCLLSGVASAVDGLEVAPAPPPKSILDNSVGRVQDTLAYALSLVGVSYKFGGKSPETGLDCSGFVSHVFKEAAGMMLPHNARAISMFGQNVPLADLQPGDLVFYNTLRRAYSHVGIYLGDNRFIHAASAGGGVEVSNMRDNYWVKRFNGARRLFTSVPAGFLTESAAAR